jgi:uncharacterized alkaline shock family protein YloU
MNERKKYDTKEFELPETYFVRAIEDQVFQQIILHCLEKIPGIAPVEGNLIENIFGRGNSESLKGIYTEQDNRNHSVSIKVEVNVAYGISIPEKAEEIQTAITEEITKLTGLHVSSVNLVFKNLIAPNMMRKKPMISQPTALLEENIAEEYSDEF